MYYSRDVYYSRGYHYRGMVIRYRGMYYSRGMHYSRGMLIRYHSGHHA